MSINVIDLFCGCGGFSHGFNSNTFSVLFATDYDKAAIETYRCNYSNVCAVSIDIAKVNKKFITDKIGDVDIDVIIGGPPCGGLIIDEDSGFDCAKNPLFFHFSRIVKELAPKIFVIENIDKIVSLYEGKLIDEIIRHFEKIGYLTSNHILSSEMFGVPQYKKRSIFVGKKRGLCSGDFGLDGIHNPIVSAYDALSDLPPLCEELTTNTYISKPKNVYQKKMRYKCSVLTEHFLLSPSNELCLNRSVDERRISPYYPSPDIDTRKKYRDQMHYYEDRLLSIRELARLQSFPDSFTFVGTDEEKIRQIGNAIPPLLANAISNMVEKYLN